MSACQSFCSRRGGRLPQITIQGLPQFFRNGSFNRLLTVKEIVLFTILAEEEQQHVKTKQDNVEDTEGEGTDNTASGQGSRDNQTLPDSEAGNTDEKSEDADVTSTRHRNLATLVEDSDEEEVTSPTQEIKLQQVCFLM